MKNIFKLSLPTILVCFVLLFANLPCKAAFLIKKSSSTISNPSLENNNNFSTIENAQVPKMKANPLDRDYYHKQRKYNPNGTLGVTSLALAIAGFVCILIGISIIVYDTAVIAFANYALILLFLLFILPTLLGGAAIILGKLSVHEKERPRAPGIVGLLLGYFDTMWWILAAYFFIFAVGASASEVY